MEYRCPCKVKRPIEKLADLDHERRERIVLAETVAAWKQAT